MMHHWWVERHQELQTLAKGKVPLLVGVMDSEQNDRTNGVRLNHNQGYVGARAEGPLGSVVKYFLKARRICQVKI